MNFKYSKQAKKMIRRLDSTTAERIQAAIENLPAGDVIPMTNRANTYRLRVGYWRILYTLRNDVILVKTMLPSDDVLTDEELKAIEEAESEFERGECFSHENVWGVKNNKK